MKRDNSFRPNQRVAHAPGRSVAVGGMNIALNSIGKSKPEAGLTKMRKTGESRQVARILN